MGIGMQGLTKYTRRGKIMRDRYKIIEVKKDDHRQERE